MFFLLCLKGCETPPEDLASRKGEVQMRVAFLLSIIIFLSQWSFVGRRTIERAHINERSSTLMSLFCSASFFWSSFPSQEGRETEPGAHC